MPKLFFQIICVLLFVMPYSSFAVTESSGFTLNPTNGGKDSAQVRILLKMQPYEQVSIKSPEGKILSVERPEKKFLQTLRARVNVANHFYFSNWHVETVPVSWKRELRKLTLKLNFYKVRGANKSLEERVGSMEVAGILVESEPGIYNLIASKQATFRDIGGRVRLSLNAGFDAEKDQGRLKVAKFQRKK